jgi:hypothetical protein
MRMTEPALNAFAITFGDRFPAAGTTNPDAGNTVREKEPGAGGRRSQAVRWPAARP